MFQYMWDPETGGLLLTTEQAKFSKEPRPVYYRELDILGFDKYWNYPKDDRAPLMWAEANNYIYRGRLVASTKGGTLNEKPEIILREDPEPDGKLLQYVDVQRMCEKNRTLMNTLVQETVQHIYNTYREYKKKIDVFYVAYSGGKDSIVTLDMVQRALPHEDFLVIFGDTGMEFSDTYRAVELTELECEHKGIKFYTARSHFPPEVSWNEFGPPCTVTRWCCSVHKTVPQVLLLREILKKPDFTGMAFVGIRADESLARSKYEYLSYGEKHKGQWSCNAILNWSSAEVFLHIFANNLVFNETYKRGNRRAGCLICPRAAERNDFISNSCYSDEARPLVEAIERAYRRTYPNPAQLDDFIMNGGWKARKNGRDLDIPLNYTETILKDGTTTIIVKHPKTEWKEWIKTIGILANDVSPYTISYRGALYQFSLEQRLDGYEININSATVRSNPEFVKLLKNVFRRAACCIACHECQADCPYGNMSFIDNQVKIADSCVHCSQCHKVEKGCLVYKSLEQPKGGILMSGKNMSLNSYSHHAPKMDWVRQYFEYKNDFDQKHSLGSQMYSFFKRFLRDAKLLDENGFSETAKVIEKIGYQTDTAWGIIGINLSHEPQLFWYTTNVDFDTYYSKQLLATMMVNDGAKESWTNDIFSSLTRIAELPIGKLGIGSVEKEKGRAVGLIRKSWTDPIPEVILYGLYKFAEKCGNYYQFSLETLLDDSIERDGVSPTRIFGLDRDTMVRLLNGLSIHYPEFISASFTLDLDTITLNAEKTAEDVLALF